MKNTLRNNWLHGYNPTQGGFAMVGNKTIDKSFSGFFDRCVLSVSYMTR